MARTSQQISESIRANLRVLDPDIGTEPLTPERKIIDTVADIIAESEVDAFVQNYQYDIDTKVGADLDKFVALFGFARQGGRAANGTVTFSRFSSTTTDLIIPAGTQVARSATSVSNAVVFQTTIAATIFVGTTEVEVPIECTVTGEIGNVAANTITSMNTTGGVSVSAVTNANPTTGGTAQETDAELRVRFKNTIFRNIAGTQDQFLALAIASRFANKANVIGPTSRFIEYLQLLSTTTVGSQTLPLATINVVATAGAPTAGTAYIGGQAVTYTGVTGTTLTGASGGTGVITAGTVVSFPTVSQIPYSKYTFNFDYWLTDGNFTSETFYTPNSADYTFNATVPPSIYVNNQTNLPNAKIILLEHTYTSKNSRNVPASSIMNYVDVYVSGRDYTTAIESCVFPTSGNNFSASSGSAFYNLNFVRVATNVAPTVGNRLQLLMWQPVVVLPATITIGVNTYTLNTDYWLVRDVTLNKGSRRAWNGIEWTAAVAGAVTAGTSFQISYTFNKLPLTLNELMEGHKQITTDVLVHAALERYFRVALTVMYTPGYSKTAVDVGITTTLTDFLERQQFGAVIQVSDILEVVHEVPGVDNVRLTTSVENGTIYGIQEMAANGTTILSTVTTDFTLQDSDLPVLNNIVTLAKSQNTWNTF